MNKDRAIQMLERMQNPEPYDPQITSEAFDALQMAIDALSADGDTISRQAVIDYVDCGHLRPPTELAWSDLDVVNMLKRMPSVEPQIIRCKDCRYYKQFGKSELGDCLALSRICKSIDFCSWGARVDSEQILSEADNDTAYGGLMSAT